MLDKETPIEADLAHEEGEIDLFEEKLSGPQGRAYYNECRQRLETAARQVKSKLARGANRKEGDELKQIERALADGRMLLDLVWEDISKTSK